MLGMHDSGSVEPYQPQAPCDPPYSAAGARPHACGLISVGQHDVPYSNDIADVSVPTLHHTSCSPASHKQCQAGVATPSQTPNVSTEARRSWPSLTLPLSSSMATSMATSTTAADMPCTAMLGVSVQPACKRRKFVPVKPKCRAAVVTPDTSPIAIQASALSPTSSGNESTTRTVDAWPKALFPTVRTTAVRHTAVPCSSMTQCARAAAASQRLGRLNSQLAHLSSGLGLVCATGSTAAAGPANRKRKVANATESVIAKAQEAISAQCPQLCSARNPSAVKANSEMVAHDACRLGGSEGFNRLGSSFAAFTPLPINAQLQPWSPGSSDGGSSCSLSPSSFTMQLAALPNSGCGGDNTLAPTSGSGNCGSWNSKPVVTTVLQLCSGAHSLHSIAPAQKALVLQSGPDTCSSQPLAGKVHGAANLATRLSAEEVPPGLSLSSQLPLPAPPSFVGAAAHGSTSRERRSYLRDEDEWIVKQRGAGVPLTAIALTVQRSERAVGERLRRLRAWFGIRPSVQQ